MIEKLPPSKNIGPATHGSPSGSPSGSPWVAAVLDREFWAPLQDRFQLNPTGRVVERRDALDTFDLRFHRAGATFSVYTRMGRLIAELCPARDETALATTYAIDTQLIPNFARDLPRGVVRDHIHQIAGERRFQRLVRLKEEAERHNILNDEGKTVVRLEFVRAWVVDPTNSQSLVALPPSLVLAPLRGYQTEFEEVIQFLEEEHELKQSAHSVIELGLAAVGWEPEIFSTRPDVSMCDSTPANVVALEILKALFDVMRANEKGVRHDLDIDYLRDFCEVVCRSHSLLRAFRDPLRATKIDALEEELAWLSEITGPVRNLDVQLLCARGIVEPAKRQWSGILKILAEQREREWHRLSENLNTERYARFLSLADRVMEELAAADSQSASNPPSIGEFVPGALEVAYAELLDGGRGLKAQTSTQEVHRLLSASKRLRDLIELFQPLCDSQPTDTALLAICKLHDELSSVHDTFVRNELLEEIRIDLEERGKSESHVAQSIVRLQEQSPREKQQASAKAWQAFLKFDLPQNRAYVVAVFEHRGQLELSPRKLQVGVEVR